MKGLINENETALIYASNSGHPSIVEYLVSKGANINYQGRENEIALYSAVWGNELDCVKLLIEKGADFNLKDQN